MSKKRQAYHKMDVEEKVNFRKSILYKKTFNGAVFLVVLVLLLMVVAAGAILFVSDYVMSAPNYTFVVEGSIEHFLASKAIVIRDEKSYFAEVNGNLVALATEGSRVAMNESIGMIIPDTLIETSETLKNTRRQIVELQRQLIRQGKGTGALAIYEEADTNILPLIKLIRLEASGQLFFSLDSHTSSIQVIMDKRESKIQTIPFSDPELEVLIQSRKTMESTLGAQAAILKAEESGIVSFKTDAWVEELTLEKAKELTSEEYKTILSQANDSLTNSYTLKEDFPVARISQNQSHYFTTFIPGYSHLDFPEGTEHRIRVAGEDILFEKCRIIHSKLVEQGVLVVFETSEHVEKLLDRRVVDIEILEENEKSGLKIPISSLIDQEETNQHGAVMINDSGYARKYVVEIIDFNREHAIIRPVSGFEVPNTSSIIITNPEVIREGEKVES